MAEDLLHPVNINVFLRMIVGGQSVLTEEIVKARWRTFRNSRILCREIKIEYVSASETEARSDQDVHEVHHACESMQHHDERMSYSDNDRQRTIAQQHVR